MGVTRKDNDVAGRKRKTSIRDENEQHHRAEGSRIQGVIASLGNEFAPNGIVRTVLAARVEQEAEAANCCKGQENDDEAR